MNGSTAKIINKSAQKYRLKPRRLKRAYNKLNHLDRGKVKSDMFTFCMKLREADVSIIQSANERRLAMQKKQRKVQADSRSGNAIKDLQKERDRSKQKPPMYRRFIAWVMLKLGFWTYETSYRYLLQKAKTQQLETSA
ncbi:hypothetical protein [Gracilimonas sediminicola]|uniref:hypothetical protein n=1 Tax=Gracilimonas sediminicola TaxID=2952158 RepID=UPI0038D4F264